MRFHRVVQGCPNYDSLVFKYLGEVVAQSAVEECSQRRLWRIKTTPTRICHDIPYLSIQQITGLLYRQGSLTVGLDFSNHKDRRSYKKIGVISLHSYFGTWLSFSQCITILARTSFVGSRLVFAA